MTQTVRGRLVAATAALVLTASAGACSAGEEPGPADESPAAAGPPPLATTVKVGKVTGKLPGPAGEGAAAEIATAVDAWWDHAFVVVDYPTTKYTQTFGHFTRGARREARSDEALLTTGGLGERIDGVTAKARRVTVDLLAVKGEPVAATARLRLVFRTTGSVEKTVSVTGSLRLTPTPEGWRVFAYDVSKGTTL